MYYLQNLNSFTLNTIKNYKYSLLVFVCITLFGYLNLSNLEKQRYYYEQKSEFRDMLLKPEEVENKKDSFDYIIDVRTPEEFEKGHLKNAINIPHNLILNDPKILFYKHKISKDDKLFFYCKSGNRSSQVITKLLDFDYKKENLYFSIKSYDELKNYNL